MPIAGRRTRSTRSRPRSVVALAILAALGVVGSMAGCVLSPMLRSAELHGSKTIKSKYEGLAGKSFAVVVSADRSIQASYPMLIGQVTSTVSERLKEKVGASGWVPPDTVLGYQFQHPQWTTWTLQRLAQELGVERLVFIDIQEFRLNEPGNQYLWKGTAAAMIGVVEADSAGESFAFQESIGVHYPTQETALSPAQASWGDVQIMLAKRVIDRSAWLFYEHDEPNVIDY